MRIMRILNKLGITIYTVKTSRYGSMYIDSSAGFIRYSDHPMFKFKASNRKVDIKLLTRMTTEEIESLITRRVVNG